MDIKYRDGRSLNLQEIEDVIKKDKDKTSLTYQTVIGLIDKIKEQEIATQMRIKLAEKQTKKIQEQEEIINKLMSDKYGELSIRKTEL